MSRIAAPDLSLAHLPARPTLHTPMNDHLKMLAPDLSREFPRSPRQTLAGYVLACRALDKCRASLAGTAGEYHFNCPLDQIFFEFSGIDSSEFQAKAAEGASDDEMAAWIKQNARQKERIEIIKWSNDLRTKRISELADELQEFLEDYIDESIAKHRPVYVWFDVYDLEEGRL
jgi:hypothetical protein